MQCVFVCPIWEVRLRCRTSVQSVVVRGGDSSSNWGPFASPSRTEGQSYSRTAAELFGEWVLVLLGHMVGSWAFLGHFVQGRNVKINQIKSLLCACLHGYHYSMEPQVASSGREGLSEGGWEGCRHAAPRWSWRERHGGSRA